MDLKSLERLLLSRAGHKAALPAHLLLLPCCHTLLFVFFCCFLYDSGFLHFFMEGNLLGPFSLLNWIILTSSGVICGKASDQTSSLFIYFHFIGVVGAWCPTDSAHCHKQKPGNSLSSFHLAKLVHSPQLSCHVIAVTAGSLRWKSINSMSLYACYWLWASCPLAQSRTTHWLCVDYTK